MTQVLGTKSNQMKNILVLVFFNMFIETNFLFSLGFLSSYTKICFFPSLDTKIQLS